MDGPVKGDDIRLVAALFDEVQKVHPGLLRVDLVKKFTGRRDFEARMVDGRVTLRRMALTTDEIMDWLGRISG